MLDINLPSYGSSQPESISDRGGEGCVVTVAVALADHRRFIEVKKNKIRVVASPLLRA